MKHHSGHNHQTHTYKGFRIPVALARVLNSHQKAVIKREQRKRSRAWGKQQSR